MNGMKVSRGLVPKNRKLKSYLYCYLIVILAVAGAGFLAWKYQDVIKSSLDWFDTEEIELTIDRNQSANSVIRGTKKFYLMTTVL